MRASTSTFWLATALFTGTTALVTGCSPEPVSESQHGSAAGANVAVPSAPVVTTPTKSNDTEAIQPATDPQLEVPSRTSPAPEAMRDPVGLPAPAAKARGVDDPKASATTRTAVLAVEGGGIRLFNPVTTAATPIPFGRPQSEVLATLERVRGPAGEGTNESCGAGPVQYANWSDGLSIVFQSNRFVGWGLDGRASGAISTAGSIGPGSTRKALDATYGNVEVRKTSLGNEFSAGGFFGLLDGPNATSRITDMWAGVNCVAR